MERPDPIDISVVIPYFNASDTIADALESVARQTALTADPTLGLEVIVVNDHSTESDLDATLARLEREHRAIVVHNRSEIRGASIARNIGIARSRGRIVAFLDADDVWLPGHLDTHLGLHAAYQPAFSASDYNETDRDLNVTRPRVMNSMDHRRNSVLNNAFETGAPYFSTDARRLFIECCPALTSAVVVQRTAIIAAGGFSIAYKRAEDVNAWTIMSGLKGGFAFSPTPTMLYRRSDTSLSVTRRADDFRDMAVQYQRLIDHPGFPDLRDLLVRTTLEHQIRYLSELRREARFREARSLILELLPQHRYAKSLIKELVKTFVSKRS